MTGEILLQIVMAMIGALGFGLLFHISGSRLITTSLLTLYGGTYSLTCLNDITDMLHEAETELQRFRWILAAVLGAAVAACLLYTSDAADE